MILIFLPKLFVFVFLGGIFFVHPFNGNFWNQLVIQLLNNSQDIF